MTADVHSEPSGTSDARTDDGADPPHRNRRRWYLAAGGIAVAALVAWLAFGYFGVQAAFIDDEVDQAGPVFDSGASADTETTPTTAPPESSAGGAGSEADAPATPPTTAAPTVQVLAQGSFVPRDHPASGTASVLGDGTDQRFLRFEDFATDNGPDLNVYLSTAPADADQGAFDDDFVDLGDLQGNVGDQNYEVPADVDLSRYRTVVIWCVRFGVAFGAADLAI
ncbi:MAG TPA: DM13 domain-containing protein [Acidimicrobiales bacterium]|nr:DM13 domain-containing protein [Acidimicrobiales bacterium]